MITSCFSISSVGSIVSRQNVVRALNYYRLYLSEEEKIDEVKSALLESLDEMETPAENLKREKKEEIEELRAKEVFVTRNTGRYECQSCGYMYDIAKGLPEKGIPPNTAWEDIGKFRCPNCGARKSYFIQETETLSGFKENLKYGLGTNALTSGQKNLLIFGGLGLAFLLFMSGYLLE